MRTTAKEGMFMLLCSLNVNYCVWLLNLLRVDSLWFLLNLSQIITTEEAERRGEAYDSQGATYLFDLDYVEDVFTVDAANYGNVSHFVNHSVSESQMDRCEDLKRP